MTTTSRTAHGRAAVSRRLAHLSWFSSWHIWSLANQSHRSARWLCVCELLYQISILVMHMPRCVEL